MRQFNWSTARVANPQKYAFKRWPDRKFPGLIERDYIAAGYRKILCSGLWGMARQFGFLAEWFRLLSTALVSGRFASPKPCTSFIFTFVVCLSRQDTDDRYCAEKPAMWAECRASVKYWVVPGVS